MKADYRKDVHEGINIFKNLTQEEKARAEGILIGMQIQKETGFQVSSEKTENNKK